MNDLDLYRAGLTLIVEDREAFFASDVFVPFVELLERRFAGNARSLCVQWGYPVYAREETGSLVLTSLLDRPALCHRLLTDPDVACPFSYVGGRVLREWVGADSGHLPKHRPEEGPRTMYRTSIDAPGFVDRDTRDPFADVDDRYDQHRARITSGGATSLVEAIRLTVDALTPRTPRRLREDMPAAVFWMAYNPVQRKGHEDEDLRVAYRDLPELAPAEVRAIANITWGTRGTQSSTSLLGAYLLDRGFDYSASATHRSALVNYRVHMHKQRDHLAA